MQSKVILIGLFCLFGAGCSAATPDAANATGNDAANLNATLGNAVLAQNGAAPPPAANSAAPPASSGVMASVPITLGYYVSESDSCADPVSVMWFGPSSFKNISDDGTYETHLKSAEKEADGTYVLNFVDDEADEMMSAIMVEPKRPGHIEVVIQDNALMQLCAANELPAKFRK